MDEAAVHELLSGRTSGAAATLLRGGLRLAACVYSSVMMVRNAAYEREWLKVHRAAAPVISLGNITTGGTGKTPMAAWLANWFVAEGRKPGLLSRGYRTLDAAQSDQGSASRSPGGNDEKLVLDRLCPGVPHLQQKDRYQSSLRAVQEFGCDVLLLDDGFQHRRLHRDLDLVLIDALQPWGYGHVLPRGLLRESRSGLARADLILITRADQCSEQERTALRSELRRFCGDVECLEIAFKPSRCVDLNWQPHSLSSVAGKKAIAFCGIGNPRGFERTVLSTGVKCEQIEHFADHHHYSPDDLSKLAQLVRASSAEVVLTTQKDLVKIAPTLWQGPLLLAVEIGVEFISGREVLESRLHQLFKNS